MLERNSYSYSQHVYKHIGYFKLQTSWSTLPEWTAYRASRITCRSLGPVSMHSTARTGRDRSICSNSMIGVSATHTWSGKTIIQFFGLHEIQLKFNHPTINMLKMDIEGFEWNLLCREIIIKPRLYQTRVLDSSTTVSPWAAIVQGSNPQCVPTEGSINLCTSCGCWVIDWWISRSTLKTYTALS